MSDMNEIAEGFSVTPSTPIYRFDGIVRQWDIHGGKVVVRTPFSVLASTYVEAEEKSRAVFDATYATDRKFWSHDFVVASVEEVGGSGVV